MFKHTSEQVVNKYHFKLASKTESYRGLGFVLSKKWDNRLDTWHVEFDATHPNAAVRIATLRFKKYDKGPLKGKRLIVLNCYAPHMGLSFAVRSAFFNQLTSVYNFYNQEGGNVIYVLGDFNSKLGSKLEEETFVGHFARGIRNSNGDLLSEFCQQAELYASNTGFNHRACRRTTWTMPCRKATWSSVESRMNDSMVQNQIDFILIPSTQKRHLRQSRSYINTSKASDHRIVVTTLITTPDQHFARHLPLKSKTVQYDYQKLKNPEISEMYKQLIMEQLDLTVEVSLDFNKQHEIISKVSEKVLPTIERTNYSKLENDEVYQRLQTKAKCIRMSMDSTNDKRAKLRMRKRVKVIRRKIKKAGLRVFKEKWAKTAKKLMEEMRNKPVNLKAVYKHAKALRAPKYNKTRLLVKDDYGRLINSTDDKLVQMALKVSKQFYSEEQNQEGDGDDPEVVIQLNRPIDEREVQKAIKELNNGKSAGPDGLVSEQFKALPDLMVADLTYNFNNALNSMSLGGGIKVMIPKPNKAPTVENMRPITLLNTVRKILSIIVLRRINVQAAEFVNKCQSAYQKGRGTDDAVFAHRLIISKGLKFKWKTFVLGIDLSKAFDTIDRRKLMSVLEGIVDADCLYLISKLMCNTSDSIRLEGILGDSFETNMGVPQGDSISPILFIIYLEAVMRDFAKEMMTRYGIDIPTNIIFADDVDFVVDSEEKVEKILAVAPEVFQRWGLTMNSTKTEVTCIEKVEKVDSADGKRVRPAPREVQILQSDGVLVKNTVWEETKKLGSLLDIGHDLRNRTKQAKSMYAQCYKLWKQNLSVEVKVQFYKSFILSILLYNCGTWGLTNTQIDRLEGCNRAMLRRLIGCFYPNKISCEKLYEVTKTTLLYGQVMNRKWKLFRKVLEMDEAAPAMFWLREYFKCKLPRHRGKSNVTLAISLMKDLKLVGFTLCDENDLNRLQEIAKNNSTMEWEDLVERIVCAKTKELADRETKKRARAQATEMEELIFN